MAEIRSHEDCIDNGLIYFPIKEAKEFCDNCKYYQNNICYQGNEEKWLPAEWCLCAKYERREL